MVKDEDTQAISQDHVADIRPVYLSQHENNTKHSIDWSNFRIVWQDNNSYWLLIKESLLIQAFRPELKRTTHSIPLIVFASGLSKNMLPGPNG